MAGHLGNKRVTIKNLEVAAIDEERELILLRGAVPGSRGSKVLVTHKRPQPPVEDEIAESAQVSDADEKEEASQASGSSEKAED